MKHFNDRNSNRRDSSRRNASSYRLGEKNRDLAQRRRSSGLRYEGDSFYTRNTYGGERDFDNFGSEFDSGLYSSRKSDEDDRFSSDYGPGSHSSRFNRETEKDLRLDRGERSESRYGLGSGRTFQIGGGSTRVDYSGMGPKNYRRSDERICDEICDLLTESRDVDASNLDVKVKNGIVTINGQLSDKWMKYQAEELAEGVRGVMEVRNEIRVSKNSGQNESWNEKQSSTPREIKKSA